VRWRKSNRLFWPFRPFCVQRRGARAGLALVLVVPLVLLGSSPALSAAPTVISTDTLTGGGFQHATEVEPHAAAFGSKVVAIFQVGRYNGSLGSQGIGWASSSDAGSTWTQGILPGLTVASTPAGPYDGAVDPTAAYDQLHGVWLLQAVGVTKVGTSTANAAVTVNRSTDTVTWSNPVVISAASQPDKDWLACDNWAASPNRGSCYSVWSNAGQSYRLSASVSRDGGLTWSTPVATANAATGYNLQVVVQPTGKVIVVGTNVTTPTLVAYASTDGGTTWSAPTNFATMQSHTVSGGLRANHKPSVGVDMQGKVFVLWPDCRFRTSCTQNDLALSTSPDGTTWSSPARIPLDDLTSTVDHFQAGIGVDQSAVPARIGIVYFSYPTANCTSCQLNAQYTESPDGGANWSEPTTFNASAMSPSWLPLAPRGGMLGDYYPVVFSSGNAVPVFPLASAPSGSTFAESMNAAAIAPVTLTAPVSTSSPTVSGGSQFGQTLTATSGGWQGARPISYAYQWQRCDQTGAGCVDIAFATSQTYTTAGADVGSTIRVVVTASNVVASSAAASAVTAVIQSPGPVTGLLDDFNRPDNLGPPSSSWSQMGFAGSGSNQLQIVSGQVTGMVGSTADYWNVQQFGPDSEAWVTIATKPAGDLEQVSLGLRLQNPGSATGNGYQGYFYNRTPGTDEYKIWKRVNGVGSLLAAVVGPELQPGDQLLFRAVGSTLDLWVGHAGSWTKALTATDTTYTGSGFLGLSTRNNVVRLDNFGGGT